MQQLGPVHVMSSGASVCAAIIGSDREQNRAEYRWSVSVLFALMNNAVLFGVCIWAQNNRMQIKTANR